MKNEDIAKHLVMNLSSEIDGAEKYLAMAEKAEEMEEHELMTGVLDMAEDEYSHAEFIRSVMHEKDISVPDDVEKKFSDLEKKMNSIFR